MRQEVALLDTFYYTPNEFYVLRTEAQVPVGVYHFSCSFTGSLIDNGLVGFYYSDYIDENNQNRYSWLTVIVTDVGQLKAPLT